MELSENARKLKNDYLRAWKKKNREKVREYTIKQWNKKAATIEPIVTQSLNTIEETVLSLHKQGLSLREIATKLGLNHMKVSRIISKCNEL